MNALTMAMLAGGCVGLGVSVLVRELLPAHPDLAGALDRLSGRGPRAGERGPDDGAVPSASGVQGRLGGWVMPRLAGAPWVLIPTRELQLLRQSPQTFLGQKVLLAAIGLVFPALFSTVIALIGWRLPLAVPAVAGVLLAAALWWVPDLEVRAKAQAARGEFARAICAYLDLVALERAAGSGTVQSLEKASMVGDSWVFHRLQQELQLAQLTGVPPWDGLGELAEQLSVPALQDLADIMRLSGEQGAAVYESLRARARGLRNLILSQHESAANAASDRMVLPGAALSLVFMALLGYPFIARILFA